MRFIAPVVTNDTRSMIVEAVVPNPDGAVASGPVRHGRVGASKKQEPRLVVPAQRRAERPARWPACSSFATAWPASRSSRLGETARRQGGDPVGADGQGDAAWPDPELVRDGDARPSMNQLAAICVKRPVFATVLDPGAGGVRRVRLLEARGRPLSQGRLPDRHRDHAPAGLRARGNRDRDHRQDRRGRQHGQRHRRAAVDLLRGHLAGLHHVRCWRRTSTSRRRTCATRSTACCRELPEGHRPADRREAGPRRDARC